MSIKKSISWTDITRNPIKGRCQGGCQYCYTDSFYTREFLTEPIRLELSVFKNLPKKKSKKVFLCSTHDLFGYWISRKWRDEIFSEIGLHPQHTFQILTKFPWNIDRPMPPNVWLGTTLTGEKEYRGVPQTVDMKRLLALERIAAQVKFISYEPLLGEPMAGIDTVDWIIVGRMTGHGRECDPPRAWIEKLVRNCREGDVKIFMKNNLADIWGPRKLPGKNRPTGPDLIQEFPEGS